MTRSVLDPLIGVAVAAAILAFPMGAEALDVAPWQRVLTAHAKADGFDYRALSADPHRMADMRRFMRSIATMDDDEPLASWLNAYNALVVHAIVRRDSIRSVQDIDGFFDTIAHRVAGRSLTLDDIEHRIIRARFPDARVHVALNCGARSCPALHRRAFDTSTLDATLDRLARAVVASERHVRIVAAGLEISEIFFWFHEDFERDAGSVIAWIRRYGGDRFADLPTAPALSRIPYDWRLNSAR